VPEHWEVSPIKYVIDKIESGTSVNSTDEPAGDFSAGVLKTSCVYSGVFNPFENKTVIEQELDRVSCPLKADTLIVSRMNTPDLVGATGLVINAPSNLYLPDRLWQISFKNAKSAFIYYWTQSNIYRAFIKITCTGTSSSMQNLGQDQFRSFILAAPNKDEQRIIAAFLVRETAKIDALIAEQQRLIELLKEKRQAVISHAVTKGLNPDAPMKDSGIEWLGEVPAHWEIMRVKHVLTVLTDYTANGSFASLAANVTYLSEGFSRLVRLTDLRENLDNQGLYVDERAHNFLSKSELFGGEVLIANVGAYAGYSCLMPYIDEKATLGPNMYLMRFDEQRTSNIFLQRALSAGYMVEQLVLASTSTAQPKLNKDDVRNCVLVLPDTSEQKAIIAFINSETAKLDTLTAEAQHAVSLLQERRSALISAAVTGKIDVRGLVSTALPEEAAA